MWVGAEFTGLEPLASECITDAENEIRKRLAAKYDVSGDDWQTSTGTVPPAITTICKWLAIGYLHEATARGSKDAYLRADRYIKKAEKNIDDLLSGKAILTDSSGDAIAVDTTAMPVYGNSTDYSPTFNEDSPLNWAVDPDKLDDIDDDRE